MAFGIFKRRKNDDGAEMSFIDHLDVLRGHLIRSVIAIAVGAVIVGIYNDFFIEDVLLGPTHGNFPTYSILCRIGKHLSLGDALCMEKMSVMLQNTVVGGQFSMFFTVVFVGGVIIAFPYIFWEFWSFVKPALTNKELTRTRGVIFWVSFLFFSGVFFGYYVIAPYTVNFFANFQLADNIENRWTIGSYVDTLVPLILGSGLAFQLPLVLFFLTKIGVVSPAYLRRMRRYAIVVIFIIGGAISPPDAVSQLIISLPLLLLYEISIWLSARVHKEEEQEWS
jgi:sec-independent protein translocase protein TatC